MNKFQKGLKEEQEGPFKKGMTLEQYMSQANFQKAPSDSLDQSLQENLYQSSHYGCRETLQSKKRHYRIDEIDQESVQDSKDYHGHEETLETPGFERIEQQDTIIEQNENNTKGVKGRTNSISLSTAITFKNNQPEPNNFKIKRHSISPQKKKNEQHYPFPGASITLYGCKFGQAHPPQPPPKQNKMPEMLTFYGKLHLQPAGDELLGRKGSVKESQLKQKFKKKNPMELNRVLQFESPSRGLGGYKTNYPNLRVEGVNERRNKFM